jgi:Ca2+/Na+ antiporter
MNIIVLLYATLFVLIIIESIKMHGIYSPVRIIVYSVLSLLMGNLTVITLSIIIFIAVVYVVIKVIGFLFFSSKNKKEDEDEEETAGSILGGGFREFKSELRQWEEDGTNAPEPTYEPTETKKAKRKRPKITRRRKKIISDDDVPRLHPD